MLKHCVAVLLLAGLALPAQELNMKRPSEAEREAVLQAVDALILATNNRDFEAFRAITHERFFVWGEGWLFDRSGYPRAAQRKAEPEAKIAAVTRFVRMVGDSMATVDGYFRTSGLKSDYAGDFNGELLKVKGKWTVLTIHFTPYFFEAPHSYRITLSHTATPGEDGWITLFDGKSLDAFVDVAGGAVAPVWQAGEGALRLKALPAGGPRLEGQKGLRTRDTFASFELEFQWKMPAKGNSGLKYGLMYLTGHDGAGFEYQIADDAGDRGAMADPRQRSGAMYEQHAPRVSVARPVGEWNESRIVVRGRTVEHWLNGEKVVDVELPFAVPESPFVLQNHTTDAWFRNIRVRRLN